MSDIEPVWNRITAHANQQFHTKTRLPFTYEVPGDFLRVTRDGREIDRSLSKTNFRKALGGDASRRASPHQEPARDGVQPGRF